RRDGGRHHAYHHDDPHHEYSTKLDGLPRRAHRHHPSLASWNHAESRHVHAAHPHIIGKPNEISPSQRGDDSERGNYDSAIAPQYGLERTHRCSTRIIAPPSF